MEVADDAGALTNLTEKLRGFLHDGGYGGLDVDWEPMPRNKNEGLAHARLLSALRAGLGEGVLLTVDTREPRFLVWEEVLRAVDAVNLMGYDYHGWEDHAGHNAPLYPTKTFKDPCGDVSISGTVEDYLQGRKVPPEKIRLGLPFYGHSFTGPGFYQKTTGESRLWTFTDVWRLLSRPDVRQAWDSNAAVPSAHSTDGNQHVSYDDAQSLGEKVAFARGRSLGGVFVWALGFDEIEPGKMPLFEAVSQARLP